MKPLLLLTFCFISTVICLHKFRLRWIICLHFMSDDCEHAYTQCSFTPWWYSIELLGNICMLSLPLIYFSVVQFYTIIELFQLAASAGPFVPDFILCYMDGSLRHCAVDYSCLCFNLVMLLILLISYINTRTQCFNSKIRDFSFLQVALPISWLVITVCSIMVCYLIWVWTSNHPFKKKKFKR